MRLFHSLVFLAFLLAALAAPAQTRPAADSTATANADPGRDLRDLLSRWHPRMMKPHPPEATMRSGHRQLTLVPVVGYSLQTRAVASVTANMAYQNPGADVSSLTAVAAATQNRQLLLTVNFMTWDAGNRGLWLGDYRLLRYPQSTYGLGMFPPDFQEPVTMDYNYLRLYQSRLWRVAGPLYAGLGYQLDWHWNIVSRDEQEQPLTSVSAYRQGVTGRSVSSGPAATLLLDTRQNQLSPVAGGWFLRGLLRSNLTALGSDTNYQRLQLEGRHYVGLGRGGYILALWSYNDFTLGGDAPFLDLPATGWDTYSNTGRGYIQGRFRGRSLLYDEAELRLPLTRDQLLGAVLFANAEAVPEVGGGYRRVAPGGGAGLRIRLNKHSRANLALDYGLGTGNSHGLFVNLGEVF